MKIISIGVFDVYGNKIPTVMAGQAISIRIEIEVIENEVQDVEVRLEFYDLHGHLWFLSKNSISDQPVISAKKKLLLSCHFPKFPLNKNIYHLHVAAYTQNELADEILNATTLEVESGLFYSTGKLPPSNRGFLVDYNWTVIEL